MKYYQDYELWLLTTKRVTTNHRSKYTLGTANPSPHSPQHAPLHSYSVY